MEYAISLNLAFDWISNEKKSKRAIMELQRETRKKNAIRETWPQLKWLVKNVLWFFVLKKTTKFTNFKCSNYFVIVYRKWYILANNLATMPTWHFSLMFFFSNLLIFVIKWPIFVENDLVCRFCLLSQKFITCVCVFLTKMDDKICDGLWSISRTFLAFLAQRRGKKRKNNEKKI